MVFVGEEVSQLLESEKLTQVQMSLDLNYSEQLISHIKQNRRKMSEDMAIASLKLYDSPFYTMGILHKFSDGCSPPVFEGNSVERHRLAFEETMATEAQEVINILDEVSLVKNPALVTREERERIKDAIGELLDVEAWARNFSSLLATEYNISLKECYHNRIPVWKAKGWLEK